jgi:hypothetical protein
MGDFLGGFPELPKQGLAGDLRVTALLQPAEEALGLCADQRIALGMSDYWLKSGKLKLVKGLVEGGRNREVGKFDEQVVFLIQGVAGGVVANVLEVFKAEMEVAAGGESKAAFEGGLNFISALFYQFGNEGMGGMGVRRADDVGDAVGDSHFGHRAGDIEGIGTVVEARKYVAMHVDHVLRRIAQRRVENNGRGGGEKQNKRSSNRIGPPIAMSTLELNETVPQAEIT